MALYDDYFTNEDKPFAENLNDALLLSNVFDMTVPIEFPKMFSNSTWVSTTSPRKCGVAVLTLKDGLPSGVSVGTDSGTGNSTLTGTGTVKLSFYPNFNSFGKFKSMTWENTGTIVVNLKTATGTTIASNISKGTIDNQSSELRTLQEIVIEIVFTNATLKSFEVVMENKQQTRYGAEVGISDVTDLQTTLNGKADSTHEHGNLSNDGKISTTSSANMVYFCGVDSSANTLYKSNKLSSDVLIDATAHSNIGSSANASQSNINSSIDTALSNKSNSTHTHGNVSNDGKIGSASGKIIVTGTNGVLQGADTITKSKISDFPTSMTPTSHTHGNVSNVGAIGTTSGKIITTTTNGVLTASSTITKSKISDFPTSMTPTSHTHGNVSNDGKIGSTANKPLITTTNGQITTGMFGTTTGTFAEGNHSHNSWQEVTLSNQYASLYVNMDFRLAEFKYYQQNVSFPSTSDQTVASGIIPTEYRPVVGGVPVTLFNPKLGGNIDSATGNFNVATTETGNKIVNAYGIWRF